METIRRRGRTPRSACLLMILILTMSGLGLGTYPAPAEADNLGVVRARAAAGDGRALTQLGMAYYFGREVTADLPKALELLERAREAGDSLALAMLGVHALRTQQADQAVELLAQAAAAGHALAQRNLGALYLRGAGVEADSVAGLAVLEAAVAQGDAAAMVSLAAYLLGQPARSENLARARQLVRRAAALGEPRAQVRLAQRLLDEGDGEGLEEAAYFIRAAGVMSNNTAWVLATAPDAAQRDGERAVRLMEILLGDTDSEQRNGEWVDTLAAAYAEVGRFEAAVATQEEAIALLEAQADAALLDGMRARLKKYRNGRPYREALQ